MNSRISTALYEQYLLEFFYITYINSHIKLNSADENLRWNMRWWIKRNR